jgi:hypothetical protein
MSWLPLPLLYSKTGSKTVEAVSFKKALSMSQPVFKPKSPISSPQGRICGRTKKQTPLTPHSGTFNGGKGVKTIRKPFCSMNTATADLFLFERGKVEAGRPLAVPGSTHDELGEGRLNQQQKRVRHRFLAIDGPCMILPNRQQAGLKKS